LAIDALRTARQRRWRYDWVLDIDVQGYFDSIDWTLLLKADSQPFGQILVTRPRSSIQSARSMASSSSGATTSNCSWCRPSWASISHSTKNSVMAPEEGNIVGALVIC
jgi:hypothetical protein